MWELDFQDISIGKIQDKILIFMMFWKDSWLVLKYKNLL